MSEESRCPHLASWETERSSLKKTEGTNRFYLSVKPASGFHQVSSQCVAARDVCVWSGRRCDCCATVLISLIGWRLSHRLPIEFPAIFNFTAIILFARTLWTDGALWLQSIASVCRGCPGSAASLSPTGSNGSFILSLLNQSRDPGRTKKETFFFKQMTFNRENAAHPHLWPKECLLGCVLSYLHLRCVPFTEVASSQTEKTEWLITALFIAELRPYGSQTDEASQWTPIDTITTCISPPARSCVPDTTHLTAPSALTCSSPSLLEVFFSFISQIMHFLLPVPNIRLMDNPFCWDTVEDT